MNQDVIKEDEELHEIDLLKLVFDCLDILKRVWLLLVLLMAIVAAAVFIVQKKQHVPVYQAYCSFSVQIVNKSNTGELDSVYGFYYDKDLAELLLLIIFVQLFSKPQHKHAPKTNKEP